MSLLQRVLMQRLGDALRAYYFSNAVALLVTPKCEPTWQHARPGAVPLPPQTGAASAGD